MFVHITNGKLMFCRAGLIGAGAYAILTNSFQISPRNALLAFSFLPAIMLLSFFAILPREPLRLSSSHPPRYEAVEEEDVSDGDEGPQTDSEHESLLASSMHSPSGRTFPSTPSRKRLASAAVGFQANLRRARGLFFP